MGKILFRSGDEDEHQQVEEDAQDGTDGSNKRADMLMAPYDFDKYEMMSTSHQIQDLLSKKLDTPKGSSASENDGQQPEVVEEDDEYLFNRVNQQMPNHRAGKNSSMLSQGQHGRSDTLIGVSPEPRHKYMNSLFAKQRTERKVTATT